EIDARKKAAADRREPEQDGGDRVCHCRAFQTARVCPLRLVGVIKRRKHGDQMAAPGGTSEAHDPQPIHLYQQRFKLHAWIRSRLWAQVMVGMALGFAVGTGLSPDIGILDAATAELLGAWLALP